MSAAAMACSPPAVARRSSRTPGCLGRCPSRMCAPEHLQSRHWECRHPPGPSGRCGRCVAREQRHGTRWALGAHPTMPCRNR
eukprot:362430-Chlamydomonas_euryale.AAC.10